MNKISVIVPVYNVEKYLDKCVQSIVNQTYENLEIILVDDGSMDSSPEICDSWAEKDSRIEVIHKENGGLSTARNAGIEIASGEYLMFIDSDDYINQAMCEKLYLALVENDADISLCGVRRIYQDHSEDCAFESGLIDRTTFFDKIEAYNGWLLVISCNKIYRKSLFDDKRYPVGKIHEDEFMTNQMLYSINKIFIIEDVMYYYLQRDNSIMGKGLSTNSFHCLQAYLERCELFADHNEEMHIVEKMLHITLASIYDIISKIKFNDEAKLLYRDCLIRYRRVWKKAKSYDIPIMRKVFYFMNTIDMRLCCKIKNAAINIYRLIRKNL